jgi:1,4-dihydroxy-2-naphthoyl-CoA hydrolase
MASELPIDRAIGFDAQVGLEIVEAGDGQWRGQVPVRDEIRQPYGLVHGGVYAAVAETLASYGTAVAVMPEKKIAMGLSNHTSFLRPITEGAIHAVARPQHRGRTTWVWEVQMLDDDERLCAVTRVTMAVRDAPGLGAGASASDGAAASEGGG